MDSNGAISCSRALESYVVLRTHEDRTPELKLVHHDRLAPEPASRTSPPETPRGRGFDNVHPPLGPPWTSQTECAPVSRDLSDELVVMICPKAVP